jgi:hypothetical protein
VVVIVAREWTPPTEVEGDGEAGTGEQENPAGGGGILWLHQVDPQRVSWLWQGRLPRGKLVILDGDPGVGKSTVVIDWIARISTGTPWPDETACRKGKALIMSAEDGAADTIRPRLDAAGGDPENVALWTEVVYKDDEGNRKSRPPLLPEDIGILAKKIAETGAELVMIDVLMAYLSSSVDAHKDQDIRGALHLLARAAEKTNCCIIILRHLNKSGGSNAIYRGGGSIGIIGQARAAFIAVKHPDDESGNTRVLACSKMNIAKEPEALTYTLVKSELHGCARVKWGDATELTASELLGAAAEEEPNALDDAVGWLQKYLLDNGGEASSADTKEAARKKHISDRTLQRAIKDAGVTVRSEGFPRRTTWSIDPNGPHPPQSRQSLRDGATGGRMVTFPQVAPSGDSRATPSGATGLGATGGRLDGSPGAAENNHRE